MVWTTENHRTFNLENPRVTATCTVLKLADGSYRGFVGWKEDGKVKNAQTEPFDTDLDAMCATEKLLEKLELEIEGAPVVETKEAQAKRPLWQPISERCYRPSLELVGGAAEIRLALPDAEKGWRGIVTVGDRVYPYLTADYYAEFDDARIATERLMAFHGVMFARHDLHDDTEAPKQTRFAILTKASHALERGIIKHGNAESSLERIANLWNTYIKQRPFPEEDLAASEVSEMLTLFKIARNQTRPNTDNYIDGIGYLALAAECAEASHD